MTQEDIYGIINQNIITYFGILMSCPVILKMIHLHWMEIPIITGSYGKLKHLEKGF